MAGADEGGGGGWDGVQGRELRARRGDLLMAPHSGARPVPRAKKHAPAAAPVAQLLLAAALASGPGGCTGPSVPTVEWRTGSAGHSCIRRHEDSLISLSDPVRNETAFPLPTFHI